MTYPRYLFITHYWWTEGWFLDSPDDLDCTVDELIAMVDRSIAADHFPDPPRSEFNLTTDVTLVSVVNHYTHLKVTFGLLF